MYQQWRQVGFKKQANMEENVPVTLTYLSKTSKFEPKKNQALQSNNESFSNKIDQQKSQTINTDQLDNQKNLYSPRMTSPDYKVRSFLSPASKKSKTTLLTQSKQQNENLIKLAKGVYRSIENFKKQVNRNLERQLQKINKVIENMYKIQSDKNITQNEIQTKKSQLQQTLRSFQNLRRQLNQIKNVSSNSENDDFVLDLNPQKNSQKNYAESSMANLKNYKSSRQMISPSINPQIAIKSLRFKREPTSLTVKQQISRANGDTVFR